MKYSWLVVLMLVGCTNPVPVALPIGWHDVSHVDSFTGINYPQIAVYSEEPGVAVLALGCDGDTTIVDLITGQGIYDYNDESDGRKSVYMRVREDDGFPKTTGWFVSPRSVHAFSGVSAKRLSEVTKYVVELNLFRTYATATFLIPNADVLKTFISECGK